MKRCDSQKLNIPNLEEKWRILSWMCVKKRINSGMYKLDKFHFDKLNEPPHDKTNGMTCAPKQRLRLAKASTQSDQSLRCALTRKLTIHGFFMRTAKTDLSLCWTVGFVVFFLL